MQAIDVYDDINTQILQIGSQTAKEAKERSAKTGPERDRDE